MMNDESFIQKVKAQQELTEKEQISAGAPVKGNISVEYTNFADELLKLIDSKALDPYNPETFLNVEVYEKLDDDWKDKTDLALVNIGQQMQLIADFCKNPDFSNNSPQLETMVEQLWQMKQKIEEYHDVFKF